MTRDDFILVTDKNNDLVLIPMVNVDRITRGEQNDNSLFIELNNDQESITMSQISPYDISRFHEIFDRDGFLPSGEPE